MWVGKCLIELIPHFLYFYFAPQRRSNLTSVCQPYELQRASSQLVKVSAPSASTQTTPRFRTHVQVHTLCPPSEEDQPATQGSAGHRGQLPSAHHSQCLLLLRPRHECARIPQSGRRPGGSLLQQTLECTALHSELGSKLRPRPAPGSPGRRVTADCKSIK